MYEIILRKTFNSLYWVQFNVDPMTALAIIDLSIPFIGFGSNKLEWCLSSVCQLSIPFIGFIAAISLNASSLQLSFNSLYWVLAKNTYLWSGAELAFNSLYWVLMNEEKEVTEEFEIYFQFPLLGSLAVREWHQRQRDISFNSLYWVQNYNCWFMPIKCIVTFNSLYWVRLPNLSHSPNASTVLSIPFIGFCNSNWSCS